MAGIYIHIPFCKSRCIYCDFFTSTNEAHIEKYVNVLCREIEFRKNECLDESVQTIYFGGGTPSRLQEKYFQQIFNTIKYNYVLAKELEITVEANPDDLSPEYIDVLQSLPFNRLSVGIQSFDDAALKFLRRRHNSIDAINAIRNCQTKGFANISIDLMYGLPNQTLTSWKKDIQQAIDLNIQHISAYHLIYEKKTRLYTMLQTGMIENIDEDVSVEMFKILIENLKKAGYEHYEISAFAKPGFISKHNSSYWTGQKYVGFGPSAHSFDGEYRWWNVSSFPQYMDGINNAHPVIEKERIDLITKYNEYIITGLRTAWGIDLNVLKQQFGNELYTHFLHNAQKFFDLNYLKRENTSITFTRSGIFISDGIMSELMKV